MIKILYYKFDLYVVECKKHLSLTIGQVSETLT